MTGDSCPSGGGRAGREELQVSPFQGPAEKFPEAAGEAGW